MNHSAVVALGASLVVHAAALVGIRALHEPDAPPVRATLAVQLSPVATDVAADGARAMAVPPRTERRAAEANTVALTPIDNVAPGAAGAPETAPEAQATAFMMPASAPGRPVVPPSRKPAPPSSRSAPDKPSAQRVLRKPPASVPPQAVPAVRASARAHDAAPVAQSPEAAVRAPAAARQAQSDLLASAPVTVPGAKLAFSAPRFEGEGFANTPPRYPYLAKRRNEQGKVVLRVEVSPSGEPAAVSVERSSGYRRLDEAALEAVRKWRFAAARRDGIAVSGSVEVPVSFKLTD